MTLSRCPWRFLSTPCAVSSLGALGGRTVLRITSMKSPRIIARHCFVRRFGTCRCSDRGCISPDVRTGLVGGLFLRLLCRSVMCPLALHLRHLVLVHSLRRCDVLEPGRWLTLARHACSVLPSDFGGSACRGLRVRHVKPLVPLLRLLLFFPPRCHDRG